jgi:hypothetical protein
VSDVAAARLRCWCLLSKAIYYWSFCAARQAEAGHQLTSDTMAAHRRRQRALNKAAKLHVKWPHCAKNTPDIQMASQGA